MKLRTKLIALGAVAFFLFLGGAAAASAYTISNTGADSHGDFVLEPGKIEIFMNPGETVTKNISVISRVNHKVKFGISIEDFVGSQNPDTPVLLLGKDKSPYSFKDNITPETSTFSLDLGQKIQVPITITAPKNAQPGGFYSSVVVSNIPDMSGADAAATTRIISRVGVLLFIRINGPVKEEGNVQDFRVNGPRQLFLQGGPLTFEILFKNSGSVHLVPYGTVTITNLFGQKVADIPVDAYFSLPDSLRYRQVTWPKEFLFGYYKAHLELHRGYSNSIDTKDISFFVLPWKYVGAIILIFFIIALLYYVFTRKFELKRKA